MDADDGPGLKGTPPPMRGAKNPVALPHLPKILTLFAYPGAVAGEPLAGYALTLRIAEGVLCLRSAEDNDDRRAFAQREVAESVARGSRPAHS